MAQRSARPLQHGTPRPGPLPQLQHDRRPMSDERRVADGAVVCGRRRQPGTRCTRSWRVTSHRCPPVSDLFGKTGRHWLARQPLPDDERASHLRRYGSSAAPPPVDRRHRRPGPHAGSSDGQATGPCARVVEDRLAPTTFARIPEHSGCAELFGSRSDRDDQAEPRFAGCSSTLVHHGHVAITPMSHPSSRRNVLRWNEERDCRGSVAIDRAEGCRSHRRCLRG